jgi:hypothetical protein
VNLGSRAWVPISTGWQEDQVSPPSAGSRGGRRQLWSTLGGVSTELHTATPVERRLRDLVSGSAVAAGGGDDRAYARVEITDADGRPPGLLYDTLLAHDLGVFVGQRQFKLPIR